MVVHLVLLLYEDILTMYDTTEEKQNGIVSNDL